MPLVDFPAMPFVVPVIALTVGGQSQITNVDKILTVEWHRQTVRPAEGAVTFEGGVIARYGETTVRSDKLIIIQKKATETSPAQNYAKAEGHVRIEDPEGTATASVMEFDWTKTLGQGKDVNLVSAGLGLRADAVHLDQNGSQFLGTSINPTLHGPILFNAKAVLIRPDGSGSAKNVGLNMFGRQVISLKSYSFGAKEQAGLRLPNVSYNRGFGVAWQSTFFLDDRTTYGGSLRARKGEAPGVAIQMSRSLLPRAEPGGITTSLSDLSERFENGFFESVRVRSPQEERVSISYRRSSLGVSASWNQSAIARKEVRAFSKPLEIIAENGRPFGEFGLFSQVRLQQIHAEAGSVINRAYATATLLGPETSVARNLKTLVRLDGTAYTGKKSFSWAQGLAGLTYQPHPRFRMGGALSQAAELGSPDFLADRLFSSSAFHLRGDVDFGSTMVSYLGKYDFDRSKWYDNEISVRQVIGALEPYITYREFPRSFSFGFSLRLDQTLERLARRAKGLPPKASRLD